MKRSLCGLIMLSLLVALAGAAHPVRVSVAQDARPAGTLIKGEGPSVYRVMGDGTMRHVRDWATFLALGYLSQPVIQVMPDELASYQLTPPLTRWATGETDIQLYFMLRGKRYPVTDETTLKITGGTPADVSVWPDDLLNTYPVAADALTVTELIDTSPSITAAAWYAGALWAADDAGALRRLDGSAWSPVETGMEPGTAIHALEHYQDNLFAGTNTGDIWQVAGENAPWLLNPVESGPVTTLDYSTDARHWNARVGAYDFDSGHYVPGVGIGLAGGMTYGDEELFRHGTALAYDAENQVLWAGTSYAGLLRYDVAADEWENFTTLNSGIPDNTISDVQLADDGTIWIAVPGRIAHYHHGVFDVTADGMPSSSIALGSNGEVWLAGENAIGRLDGPIYTAFNTTVLLGSFAKVVLDDAGTPWFVSNRFTVHFDGQTWTAYPMYSAGNSFAFDPTLPPDTLTAPMVAPTMDYERWLQDWSRPAYDNGRCMHYLQYPAGDSYEIWEQV
ncbi:MAG TPA: hypothetical protein VHP83_25215, partial [Aggregatilineaceae bacterium]|nr:hypothetical protein [Aggregatilineaceae bacterium]